MTDQDTPPPPPPPYLSNFGPEDGPILYGEAPVMGVLDSNGKVIGKAWLAGPLEMGRRIVQLWRLELDDVELDGRWVCNRRVFERVGDAALG